MHTHIPVMHLFMIEIAQSNKMKTGTADTGRNAEVPVEFFVLHSKRCTKTIYSSINV